MSSELSRLAPTCVVAAFAIADVLAFLYLPDRLADYWEAVVIGIWVFQPMCLAIWTALGQGSIVTRLPLVLPCMVLVIAAPRIFPDGFSDVQRYEFITVVVAATSILLATAALLLVVRYFLGWRVEQGFSGPSSSGPIRFDIKYMLALLTLYSAALGVASSLRFAPYAPSLFLGPRIVVKMLATGSAIVYGMLLPMIAVPLLVLDWPKSKTFTPVAFAFWATLTSIVIVFVLWLENSPFWETVAFVLLIQSGAAIVGVAAGSTMRLTGFRLVRRRSVQLGHSAGSP